MDKDQPLIKTAVIAADPILAKHVSMGWGNGYVGVLPGHPWFRDSDPDANVHGGVTYADMGLPNGEHPEYWWLGFDTAHLGDSPIVWPRSRVFRETANFSRQAAAAISLPTGEFSDPDQVLPGEEV